MTSQVSLSARWANSMSAINTDYQCVKFTTGKREKSSSLIKWLPVITITLLPSALMAQQFTPEQMLDVMTKSPSNRDVRVHDSLKLGGECTRQDLEWTNAQGENEAELGNCLEGPGPMPFGVYWNGRAFVNRFSPSK